MNDILKCGIENINKEGVKTVTAKIIMNGNCCVCGKPLDSGLFLCEKCAAHTEADHE